MSMPPDAEARLEAAITRIADAVRDSFDVEDIAVIVHESVEVAEAFGDLDGTEKKALALALGERLVDEFFTTATPAIERMVAHIDWPLLTDGMEAAIIDPLVAKVAPHLLKPALKASLPALVDLVISAHNGGLKLNNKE